MASNVVAVTNGKGGVGKTSVAANVAGEAAALGRRVLTIDLDDQGNLGEDLGYYHDGDSDEGQSLHDAVVDGADLQVLRDVRGRDGLDSVAGGQWTGRLSDRLKIGLETSSDVADVLDDAAAGYDLVLLDTPPNMRCQLLAQALTASRWVVVPSSRDSASVKGIERVGQVVARQRDDDADGPAILGVVLFDFGKRHTRLIREMRDAHTGGGLHVFDTVVRSNHRGTVQMRDNGELAGEYGRRAHRLVDTTNRYQASKTVSLGAGGLASDYAELTAEILEATGL